MPGDLELGLLVEVDGEGIDDAVVLPEEQRVDRRQPQVDAVSDPVSDPVSERPIRGLLVSEFPWKAVTGKPARSNRQEIDKIEPEPPESGLSNLPTIDDRLSEPSARSQSPRPMTVDRSPALLVRAEGEAGHEGLLQRDEHHGRRDRDDQRGQHQWSEGEAGVDALEALQADLDHLLVLIGDDEDRPEVHVPHEDELYDGQRPDDVP